MAQDIVKTSGRKKKTDWQLFTNDGKFDSKLPPSQRLHRLKGFKVFAIPKSQVDLAKPAKPQPQVEYVENFVLVWLDQSTGRPSHSSQSKIQLQQVVNSVKIFIDSQECHTFMSTIKDEKIFVIMSGVIEENFVSTIHDAKQLESIYILCTDKAQSISWISLYPEIRGIYNTILSLCEQLGKDVKQLDRNLLGLEVMGKVLTDATSNTNRQEALFMYDQLFRDIVFAVSDESMQDMYEFCERQYYGNSKEQSFLKTLKQTYSSHPPSWWYSQEAFLYRMLNKALRTHQYDTLYVMRVFIRHLHEQIIAKQKEESIGERKLFRGQAFDKEDFERIRTNNGGLLCVSSFLSTSADREMGLHFARQCLNDRKRVSILMEITVNKNAMVPVANIADVSAYKTEQEWLFSIGSVFRVGSLERLPEGIWVIPLTLTNDQDEQLYALKEHLKTTMTDKNTCLNFGRLMYQLAAWKKSEYFYRMALEIENASQRRSILFNDLATVKGKLEQYEEALAYYHKSLKLKDEEGSDSKADKAIAYNNIGTLYQKQNKMDEALEYYQKAIKVCNAQENNDENLTATLYANISTILDDQGKYEEALAKCEESLKIRIRIFPALHPSIASSYDKMAHIMYSMKSYKNAVEYAQKALDIDQQALQPDHPQTLLHKKNLEIFKQNLSQQ